MKLVMRFYIPHHAAVTYFYSRFILYCLICHRYTCLVMFMMKFPNYSLPISSLKDWNGFRLLSFIQNYPQGPLNYPKLINLGYLYNIFFLIIFSHYLLCFYSRISLLISLPIFSNTTFSQ